MGRNDIVRSPGRSLESSRNLHKWSLRITPDAVDGVQVLHLAGRLGQASAGPLSAALRDACAAGNTRLVIDFAQVDYISSASLDVVVQAATNLASGGGILVVTSLSEPVRLALDLYGALDAVVEPSPDLAVARARGDLKR